MSAPTTQELDKLCQSHLDLSLDELLLSIPLIRELQVLMDKPLYFQRFAGLLRATTKEDPLDCTYVLKCVIELLKHADEFKEFANLVHQIGEKV
jgi:hypothetical protein